MISALHLLWILPTATMFGFFWCAILTCGKRFDESSQKEGDDNARGKL